MKKVSVVIPVYNEEAVIGDCLKSLEKQTYEDFGVIIIDDGSTDKTLDILSKLQTTNYKLQILKQKHKGPGAARNLGAKGTRGEILVFVDADMTFDKDFIKKLVEPINKGEEKGIFSKEEYVSNWENIWARCWNINEGWPEKRRHSKDYPDSQKVFRAILASEFKKAGGFDPKAGYMDDWTLSEKLGYEAKNAPGARFYHRNPESLCEIFKQAKWVAKRRYKAGVLGYWIAAIRASLPISLVVALFKSVVNLQPAFFIFKVVYDAAIFIGILEYVILGKVLK